MNEEIVLLNVSYIKSISIELCKVINTIKLFSTLFAMFYELPCLLEIISLVSICLFCMLIFFLKVFAKLFYNMYEGVIYCIFFENSNIFLFF